jgi:hypothetical protein
LASAQKRLAGEVRQQARGQSKEEAVSEIQRVALSVWKDQTNDPAARPPAVLFTSRGEKRPRKQDAYVYDRAAIIGAIVLKQSVGNRARTAVLEEKLKAIAQVLASFGVLDNLTVARQEKLLRAIYEILGSPGE